LPNRLEISISQYNNCYSKIFADNGQHKVGNGYPIYIQYIETYLLPANADGFLHAKYKPDFSQHYTVNSMADVIDLFHNELKDGIISRV
jgi:hypothetical protein